MKRLVLTLSFLLSVIVSFAQVSKMLGDWDTIDDRSGDKRSRVHVYKATDGKCYGKVLALYKKNADGTYSDWDDVPEEHKNVIGMVILKELEPDGDVLKGRCYDPESKKTYYGKVSYNAGKDQITLRGSLDKLGLLGRSQTWVRSK
ncbi:MAG: DUF2147 domain-containing protein [Paludibacteraceae bacterium]|nr:DUF2147 domain-containing protein [Paludibacteraceae bacterium]